MRETAFSIPPFRGSRSNSRNIARMSDSSVYCPHCAKRFVVDNSSPATDRRCPDCHRTCLGGEPDSAVLSESNVDPQSVPASEIDRLMPPRFLVDDPDFIDYRQGSASAGRVFLPDGEGGVHSIDSHVVRIEHQGRTIELTALPPAARRRRRIIINTVVIVLALAILILVFRWF